MSDQIKYTDDFKRETIVEITEVNDHVIIVISRDGRVHRERWTLSTARDVMRKIYNIIGEE